MPILIALYILWGVVFRNTYPVPPPLPKAKTTDYQD